MRASSFSPFFATAATAAIVAAISACSGVVRISPSCNPGDTCINGDGGAEGGGQGQEGSSCYADSDCALPTRCMFPGPTLAPGEGDGPGGLVGGSTCGSQGICKQQVACGASCPFPAQYMGCDCAGLSVSTCQCPNGGYIPTEFSVIFGAPTTALECPNDPAPPDGGQNGFDAGFGDSGDLNVTGSLTIDNFSCSLNSSVREIQSAPDGDTWTLDIDATCPVQALGHVTLFVTGKDNVTYPESCGTSGNMQLSVDGEGDAGFLAYSGENSGGSCSLTDGPLVSDQPNKIRANGTLSNGSGKSHVVNVLEP